MLDVLMPLKDRLKQLRTAADLTQQVLAWKAGLSISAVVQIESGKIPNPRMDTLQALARALGVSLDDLAGESESEPPARHPPAGPGRPRKGKPGPKGRGRKKAE
jgi:transcriptional regulator with XRE-family HTH domain